MRLTLPKPFRPYRRARPPPRPPGLRPTRSIQRPPTQATPSKTPPCSSPFAGAKRRYFHLWKTSSAPPAPAPSPWPREPSSTTRFPSSATTSRSRCTSGSFDAAVNARYLHRTKSLPKTAEEYRGGAVFASQTSIASKEDLQNFTQRWFQSHKLTAMPLRRRPPGALLPRKSRQTTPSASASASPRPLPSGSSPRRIGFRSPTPPSSFQTIDTALAQTPSSSTAAITSKLRHPATPQK